MSFDPADIALNLKNALILLLMMAVIVPLAKWIVTLSPLFETIGIAQLVKGI